jgi:excisionase family DNA binding protein
MKKDFLNIIQAAEYLGVSKQTLYRIAGERKIVSYKPERILYFKEEDLKEYILKSKREILVYNKGY